MWKEKVIFYAITMLVINGINADAIEFSYGGTRYSEISRPYSYNSVTFSENPSYVYQATDCGQGDGVSTYWKFMMINEISIQRIDCNSNKPGFRRLSDVNHDFTHDFYAAGRTGNFLIPGLGNGGNDDGIYLGFDRVRPVTAIGFIWGSIQEPSECCIRQWFDFVYMDGKIERMYIDFSNDYMGNGTESSSNTFLSFFSKNKPIRGIVINQLGHNPVLDEIRVGGIKGEDHIVIDVRNFGVPVIEPSQDIIIRTTRDNLSSEEETLQKYKDDYGKHAEKNKRISDAFREISNNLTGDNTFFEYYANRISEATLGNFYILNKLHNDPPRYDYDQLAVYNPVNTVNSFLDEFGGDFIIFDNLFRMFDSNIELLECSLITLERLQGAYLDGDKEAFDNQADLLGELWSDSDFTMQGISFLLNEINDLFHSNSFFDISGDSVKDIVENIESLNVELSKAYYNNSFNPKGFHWPIIMPAIINNSIMNQ